MASVCLEARILRTENQLEIREPGNRFVIITNPFKVSASMAVKEALRGGAPYLLDPVMRVEVFVPEAFMGDVIGDLNARGGKVESIDHRMGIQSITASVPLARMFGYSTALRSATQGRGTFSMHFSHFDRS